MTTRTKTVRPDIKEVCRQLLEHGVGRAEVAYSGEGDEGQIDWPPTLFQTDASSPLLSGDVAGMLGELLTRYVDDQLPGNYEDGNGGHGVVSIYAAEGRAHFDHNWNTATSVPDPYDDDPGGEEIEPEQHDD